jgi:hypothetical protein
MFCPNCGIRNKVEQNYCRGCGLKLDAIFERVSDQFPSAEYRELQRRKERFEKFGMYSLSVAGLIGFTILLFKATQYKLIFFGPDDLLGVAITALIGFLILSVVLLNYPKFFLRAGKSPRVSSPHDAGSPPEHLRAGLQSEGLSDPVDGTNPVTAKLIEDRPSDYVSSVTENTTTSLKVPRSIKR